MLTPPTGPLGSRECKHEGDAEVQPGSTGLGVRPVSSSPTSGPPGCVTLESDLLSLGLSHRHKWSVCDSTKENSLIHCDLELQGVKTQKL